MTTFARKLSAEEEVSLKELAASDDVVVRRRAGSILMSMEGKGTQQIAEELGISERSIRNALTAFNSGGIDSVSRRHPAL